MKKTKVNLLVIAFLTIGVTSSYAQIPNYPIDNAPYQNQPAVAVSPTYEWLLAAAWNYLPGDCPKSAIFCSLGLGILG
jgi:hypothetical protein